MVGAINEQSVKLAMCVMYMGEKEGGGGGLCACNNNNTSKKV